MERNLIAREVNDLTSYITLPSKRLFQTPKAPPAKLDEETINGYTCYVAIDIGLTDKSSKCRKVDDNYKCAHWVDGFPEKMTAIYAPNNFKAGSATDIILYLHGHLGGHPGLTWSGRKVYSPSIKSYLNYKAQEYFNFRKIINASGKNVVFVAPTLGPRSQYGNLGNDFDNYIDQVIAAINGYVFIKLNLDGQFNLRNLIIASHSGGGSAMLNIVEQSKSTYAKRIKAIWGFDSWYNRRCVKYENKICKDFKVPWDSIAQNQNLNINAYHYSSRYLPKAAKNVMVVKADTTLPNPEHFTLLPHYFQELLKKL